MPFYEYECSGCKTVVTVLHNVGEEKENIKCPNCDSSDLKKVYSPINSFFSEGLAGGSCGGNCGGGGGYSGGFG